MALIEVDERKPYWRYTKWQMLASLVPFLALIIVLPMYADQLNARKFLGFPLGFFFGRARDLADCPVYDGSIRQPPGRD